MSNLKAGGYFYSTDEATTQEAADAITQASLATIPEGRYKSTTKRWDIVRLAVDGVTYYTSKHSNSSLNEAAREVTGIQEGAGSEDWFLEE